jgi:hypothetical protein
VGRQVAGQQSCHQDNQSQGCKARSSLPTPKRVPRIVWRREHPPISPRPIPREANAALSLTTKATTCARLASKTHRSLVACGHVRQKRQTTKPSSDSTRHSSILWRFHDYAVRSGLSDVRIFLVKAPCEAFSPVTPCETALARNVLMAESGRFSRFATRRDFLRSSLALR